MPGLWYAVEAGEHDKVVNMLEKWCKIDISVDGKSLIEKAKEKGDAKIIATLQVSQAKTSMRSTLLIRVKDTSRICNIYLSKLFTLVCSQKITLKG